jgi:hypothetical protein
MAAISAITRIPRESGDSVAITAIPGDYGISSELPLRCLAG